MVPFQQSSALPANGKLGLYRDNGKENGNYFDGIYRDSRVYVRVMYMFPPANGLIVVAAAVLCKPLS